MLVILQKCCTWKSLEMHYFSPVKFCNRLVFSASKSSGKHCCLICILVHLLVQFCAAFVSCRHIHCTVIMLFYIAFLCDKYIDFIWFDFKCLYGPEICLCAGWPVWTWTCWKIADTVGTVWCETSGRVLCCIESCRTTWDSRTASYRINKMSSFISSEFFRCYAELPELPCSCCHQNAKIFSHHSCSWISTLAQNKLMH